MNSRTPRGAWNKAQLALIGVTWPPERGWIERVSGTELQDETLAKFKELATLKHRERKVIETMPSLKRYDLVERVRGMESWQEMKETPDGDFAFLHRSCIPIGDVHFEPSDKTERACNSGGCFL